MAKDTDDLDTYRGIAVRPIATPGGRHRGEEPTGPVVARTTPGRHRAA